MWGLSCGIGMMMAPAGNVAILRVSFQAAKAVAQCAVSTRKIAFAFPNALRLTARAILNMLTANLHKTHGTPTRCASIQKFGMTVV
jgi:hypothetical protein